MGIENKVVLITGAGSGLGAAAALTFAEEGAKVVLCGRRKERVEAVASRIAAAGGEAIAVQADVSSEAEVAEVIAKALEAYGTVDVLINNAAVFEAGSVPETSLASWNLQIGTNLTGVFLTTKACLSVMRAKGYGRIINITSSLAENGAGGFAAYAAAKAGVESLTRTVAEDEGTANILCNMYNPGAIKTEMHATGKDPFSIIPDLIRLASLPKDGITGKLVEAKG